MANSKVTIPGKAITRRHIKVWWKAWGLGIYVDFDRYWCVAIQLGPLDIQIYRDWEFGDMT